MAVNMCRFCRMSRDKIRWNSNGNADPALLVLASTADAMYNFCLWCDYLNDIYIYIYFFLICLTIDSARYNSLLFHHCLKTTLPSPGQSGAFVRCLR